MHVGCKNLWRNLGGWEQGVGPGVNKTGLPNHKVLLVSWDRVREGYVPTRLRNSNHRIHIFVVYVNFLSVQKARPISRAAQVVLGTKNGVQIPSWAGSLVPKNFDREWDGKKSHGCRST